MSQSSQVPFPNPKTFGQAVANAVIRGYRQTADYGDRWKGRHDALGEIVIERGDFSG